MIIALQPVLTGSPINVGAIAGLLIFSMVCFAALTFFVRGAGRGQPTAALSPKAAESRSTHREHRLRGKDRSLG